MANVRIGIPLYPKFDSLDVLGPYQVFFFTPGIEPVLIGEPGVVSIENVTFSPPYTFDDAPELDVLFVPGTSASVAYDTLDNEPLFEYLRTQVAALRKKPAQAWPRITSVCAGSILLAATGALDGHNVTTHWMMRGAFRDLDQVTLATGYPRYVHDGDVMTGGGISSGIDQALALAGLITDHNTATKTELLIQYNPSPPFHAGDPSIAPPDVWQPMLEGAKPTIDKLAKKLAAR